MSEIVICPAAGGQFEVHLDAERDTAWPRQEQMAALFGRDRAVINLHLGNAFREGEIDRLQVCAKFAQTADDGTTYQVAHYNLDAVISVGYRAKSFDYNIRNITDGSK